MKRTLSVILTLAMLLSLCTVLFVTTVSAASVTISNTSPAITANVGDTLNLADYSVTFDDGSVSSNVTWKNGSSAITSFKPTAKGVTALTATSGSKTKTVYVVAKNTNDTEYVLYEANMSDFASVQALKNEGWTMNGSSSASYAKASDGSLTLGVTGGYEIAYAYLPAWIGDFGDYRIEADVKIASLVNNDTTRWLSMIYRSDSNTTEGHYYQMAVRDAASNSGVEFAERYNASWNVPAKGSASVTSMSSAYNTLKVEAYGGYIAQSINDKQIVYLDNAAFTGNVKSAAYKGYVGFSMCGGTLAVKNVKVTLQETIPEEDIEVGLINNNNHKATNLVNPIANVQRLSSVSATTLDGLTVAFMNATSSATEVTSMMKACVDAAVVPTFWVGSNAQADAVVSAVSSTGNKDVNVISSSASVLAYIRGKNTAIRTGLKYDMSSAMADGILTPEEGDDIRLAVRSAPATFVVIDSKYAVRDAVAELQEFAIAVWAVMSESDSSSDAFNIEAMNILTAGVNGIISSDANAINNLVEKHFEESSFTRTSLIIGHRGNPSCAPENTIASFQAAYDNGADVFEIDVDITKDNVVVVLHDGTLDRTTTYDDGDPDAWGGTHVNNMTWAEVQQYYVLEDENDPNSSTGQPIPTLAEVLEWARGKDVKIFIEFKSAAASCITQTMNKVKELDMSHQVDVISFASSALTQAQAVIPGISTGYLLSNTIDATTYIKALQQLENLIQYAQNVKSTVNPQSYGGQATRHTIQAAADRGMTVWPWTYTTATTDKAFFSAADGITTDNVEAIKDMVKTVYADDAVLVVGQTYAGGTLTAETYGNERYLAEPSAIVASVIAGDAVEVQNGKLLAVKEGTATVILGYRTKTVAGTEYIVYGQPVTVTVDNGNTDAVANLFALGNITSVNDLSENDLIKLRELQQKALDIANGVQTATDAEMIALTDDIVEMLGSFYELIPIPAVSYTAPAPNYYKWDSATQSDSDELNSTYVDDGIRLIDGKKSNPNAGTSSYSAWAKELNVEIVVNYGEKINAKVFRGYFASGQWSVKAPTDMKIYYSDNGTDWTLVKGSLTKEVIIDGGWDVNEYVFTAESTVTAQYIKFYIDPAGNFTWVDEVEAVEQKGDKLEGDFVYITGIDQKITEGDAAIFTSASNPITVEDENHAWTYNIIAKWDATLGEYIVKSAQQGIGADTPDVTLADDEIMIAVHDWETGVDNYTVVKGSADNYRNAYGAAEGKIVNVYGFDSETATLSAAPYITFTSADPSHQHVYSDEWCSDTKYHWHECECTEKSDLGEHTAGTWKYITRPTATEDGEKGKYCTACGLLLETEVIPATGVTEPVKLGLRGDVTKNGEIDSRDYVFLKRAYFGTYKLDATASLLADVNNSGGLDSRDYVFLKRAYFGTYKIPENIKYVYAE